MRDRDGLFRNGNLWWMWCHSPNGGARRRSTGCADKENAYRVRATWFQACESRPAWDLCDAVVAGRVELSVLHRHWTGGTVDVLRAQLAAHQERLMDVDIEPFVERWYSSHVKSLSLTPKTKSTYYAQVRELIPAGVPLPRSVFTEDYVRARMDALGVSGSTRRRYLYAWSVFVRWARKRVPLVVNPLEDVSEWRPKNNPARFVYWLPETYTRVLARMSGDAQMAMVVAFATGLELTALLALRRLDVNTGTKTLIAHGTKNDERRDRTVIGDDWMWDAMTRWIADLLPSAPLFSITADVLRDEFYAAQAAAGLCAPGEHVHTIHDARHSYAATRLLGADGGPVRTPKYVARNLGHVDETMVMRIYGRIRAEDVAREFPKLDSFSLNTRAA